MPQNYVILFKLIILRQLCGFFFNKYKTLFLLLENFKKSHINQVHKLVLCFFNYL